jgi:hypothetical protein
MARYGEKEPHKATLVVLQKSLPLHFFDEGKVDARLAGNEMNIRET